ncbi:similar to capsular polysaccharide protein [Oleispira antarctica RB-8]|uniref:Similar to capsular polysaccharide protein n=1 Tax=Oleispira antarctica RB-8 TaxID=698738 RepID=R4YLF9_OLEAN|nr:similar to capsular polysaccharide protein [Oleispira antarctica RB-8]
MFKSLSRNVIIYGGSNAIKSLVPVLMLPILTAYLTPSEFGVLSLIETTILFLSPFILLNINSAIGVEFFKLEHSELKLYITNALLLSLLSFIIIYGVFFAFQYEISQWIGIDNEMVILLAVFSILRVISQISLGLMQVSQKVKTFALFSLGQTLLDFFLSYIFVVFFLSGMEGRLEGVYGSFFVVSVIGFYFLFVGDYIGKINLQYTKSILKFGVPLIPHVIGGTIMAMSDRYFISYYFGSAEVGLYSIAYQMSALMLLASTSVNQAWAPMLFKLLKDNNKRTIRQVTSLLAGVFIVAAFCIYMLEDVLFYIFVNDDFFLAKQYFPYLLLGFLFQSFYFLATNKFFYEKRTGLLASITILGALLNLLLNYIFINDFGVIGVAYATCLTWFIFCLVVLLVRFLLLENRGVCCSE